MPSTIGMLGRYVAAIREAAEEFGIIGDTRSERRAAIAGVLSAEADGEIESVSNRSCWRRVDECVEELNANFASAKGRSCVELLREEAGDIQKQAERDENDPATAIPQFQSAPRERLSGIVRRLRRLSRSGWRKRQPCWRTVGRRGGTARLEIHTAQLLEMLDTEAKSAKASTSCCRK